jgi:hypothetical protein
MFILFENTFENWEEEYIKQNYKNKTYREISDYLNLSNKIKKTEKQVRRKARYLNISKYNNTINKNYFENIDSQEKAYWLGFVYADGYICATCRNGELAIELCQRDIEHLKKIDKTLNANVEIKCFENYLKIADNKHFSNTKSCLIRFYSKKIVEDLHNNGIDFNKTYSNMFPKIEDKTLFLHYLRGFIDGDGCIYKSKKRYYVSMVGMNYNHLKYIQDTLLLNYNIKTSIYKKTETIYSLNINGDIIKFLDLLYKDATIYLERKYQLYQNAVCFRNKTNNEWAKSVESL